MGKDRRDKPISSFLDVPISKKDSPFLNIKLYNTLGWLDNRIVTILQEEMYKDTDIIKQTRQKRGC